MNPVILELGPLTLHAYTAWLGGGLLVALAILAGAGWRRAPDAAPRWLDAGIAAVLAGIVGARLLHVALEWDYFADRPGEITRVWLGGLAWHGGVLLAIPITLLMLRWRRVPLRPWTDALAVAWPAGMAAAWIGCREAGCGYGYEVRTLAEWPSWAVEELPDVYGIVAPRLDLALTGAAFSLTLLALVLLLTWRGWLAGLRFWLVLALSGLGLYFLGFFRADPAATLLDRRADQVFDLMMVLLGTLAGGALWIERRRAAAAGAPAEDTRYETHIGDGADQPETR